jgi:ferric-dicitrate binding protein FerR (iron transport regulator)
MTDNSEHDPDRFTELMQRVGRATEPSASTRDGVYRATHDAWLRSRRRRTYRRQLAIAASLLVCALLGSLAWLGPGTPVTPLRIASVEALAGEVRVRGDSGAGALTTLQRGRQLVIGEQIETAAGSRLVLRRPGGVTIHVAGGSELVWQTADALRVTRGLVYVDTDTATNGSDQLEIVTHTGRIRHVGTRFSVQVAELEVRVMVRDGAVSIGGSRAEQRLQAGYAADIAADGRLLSSALSPGEGPWQWLATEKPVFNIEGRSLHAVLQDLALAQGVPVSYASPQIEASARQLQMHGAPLELDAASAIDAVLLTTQFAHRAPFEIVPRP